MHKFVLALSLTAAAMFAAAAFVVPAQAQYCEGTVHGLSIHYNPETDAGFLAVRSRPRASAYKRGELYNGDKVEIFDRSGNWYKIATLEAPVLEGWAHSRWIRNDCNY